MAVLHLRIDTFKANSPPQHVPERKPTPPISISRSMISPPLSACQRYDFDAISPNLLPALEYMSLKLLSKKLHITLIVGRGRPYASTDGPALDLVIIPACPLDIRTWRTFHKIIDKTAKRYPIGRTWFEALSRSQREGTGSHYLVCQSIIQNQVLFSREGLTLLNIDRVFTLKHRLQALSNGTGPLPWYIFVASCVTLLRQTVLRFDGRPLSKGFILRSYDHLSFDDALFGIVGRVYEQEYGEIGIVDDEETDEERQKRQKRQKRPKGVNGWLPRQGPTTPVSKVDITPVTGGEWDQLLGQQCRQGAGPGVGLLTTSPCQGVMV